VQLPFAAQGVAANKLPCVHIFFYVIPKAKYDDFCILKFRIFYLAQI